MTFIWSSEQAAAFSKPCLEPVLGHLDQEAKTEVPVTWIWAQYSHNSRRAFKELSQVAHYCV